MDAKKQSVVVDFQQGNASAMPFRPDSFDFIFCRAAFKNFTQPVEAINEMHRVLRPGGKPLIVDLRKDASLDDINAYVNGSGRSWFDSLMTRWIFRSFLIKRAYTIQDFHNMAKKSRFGSCQIDASPIGLNVHFEKLK